MTPTRSTLAALPLLLCTLLGGCGSDSFIPAGTITGNWVVSNIGFTQNPTALGNGQVGGPITQTGNNLSASFHIDAPCFGNGQTTIPLTGLFNQETDNFTLESPSTDGETVFLQGTFSAARNTFSNGYFSVSGSCTGDLVSQTGDDKGAILNPRGQQIPSLSGNWSPNANDFSSLNTLNMSEQLTQSPTPDIQGDFALTGTITVTGSPCFTTGTLQPTSFISGSAGQQIIVMNDGSTLTATLGASAEGPPNGTRLYLYPGAITGGNCNGPVDINLEYLPAVATPAMKQ
jgi:hypothetical protein